MHRSGAFATPGVFTPGLVTVRSGSVMSDRIQPDANAEQEQVRGNDHDNSSEDSAKHGLSARARRTPEAEGPCDAGDAQQQKCDKYDDDHCDSHSTMFSAMASGRRPDLARSGQHGEDPEEKVPNLLGRPLRPRER